MNSTILKFEQLDCGFYDLAVEDKIVKCRELSKQLPKYTDEYKTLIAVAELYEMLFIKSVDACAIEMYIKTNLFGLKGTRMATFAMDEVSIRLSSSNSCLSNLWHYR
jgi:hypothetical protein